MRTKKCLFLLCISFVNIVNAYDGNCIRSNVYASKIYEQLVEGCMDLWTNLDLVRAINTTTEQKNELAETILKKAKKLFIHLHIKKNVRHELKNEDKHELLILIETIKEIYCSIFACDNQIYNETIHIFNAFVQKLKLPN